MISEIINKGLDLTITDNTLIFIYSILGFMVVGTLFFGIWHQLNKENKNVYNFFLRFKSLWVVVLILGISFTFNRLTAFLALILISYLTFKEYISLVPTRKADRRVLLWAYIAIPIQFYFLYIDWLNMFYLFIPLFMFVLIPIRMIAVGENKGFLGACGTIHWGLMVSAYSLGYLAALLNITPNDNPNGAGLGLLLFVMVATISNDFAQAICGKLFGKHKIIPKVSFNKTVEGFLGGLTFSMIFAYLVLPHISNIEGIATIFVGIGMSLSGIFGDVIMSAIKRDIGVKDSGAMLPGHGGILDRVDSLIISAPFFYHIYHYIYC